MHLPTLLPARAGMIPYSVELEVRDVAAPRTRGDDPVFATEAEANNFLLPARAGMIPLKIKADVDESTAPRTRGDDPWFTMECLRQDACSPHARG